MTASWKKRITNTPGSFFFAPQWYIQAKAEGATKKQLSAMVRDFCIQAQGQEPEEELVELMMDMYEA